MAKRLRIDFVSDVSCPWCVIGLKALEEALQRIGDEISTELHFQPFELNPQMDAAGEDIAQHLKKKYGATSEQSASTRDAISARGAELGFRFNMDKRGRIYNTFDAHRLLHWAELEGHQLALKHALFVAYFTEGKNPSDRTVLADIAATVGLDRTRAAAILDSDLYADEVRARERFYTEKGIHAVPAVVINDRHLIQGGQPVDVFERSIRQIAANGASN
jgi:predicted DsbA family dithiol-disulfide isomerase